MKDEKLKIVTTSDLFTEEKKLKKQKKILTTKDDVPDRLVTLEPNVTELKPILTKDVEDKKDEKEE